MYKFVELSLKEFDDFSRNYKLSSFTQSRAMANVQKAQGKQVVCFGVKENDEIIAGGLFLIRSVISKYTIVHCNQGPMIDYDNRELLTFFFNHVKQALKKYHCLHVVVTPNFEVKSRDENGVETNEFNNEAFINNLKAVGLNHQGFENTLINGVGRWMFVKDMSEINDEKQMMKSLKQSARTLINRTSKMPMVIKELKPDEIDIFIDLMEHTAQRRDFDNRNTNFYHHMMTEFGNDLRMLVAMINFDEYQKQLREDEIEYLEEKSQLEQNLNRKKNRGKLNEVNIQLTSIRKRLAELSEMEFEDELTPLAGAMFVRYGDEVTYLYSGAYEKYFNYDGPYALQKEALLWALDQEVIRYNLYGTMGEYSGSEEVGVHSFKKGFNGHVIEQPGNFVIVVSPLMNSLYSIVHKIRS